MIFFRALIIVLGGILLGIFNIGFISALPYPYSEFPLFPIVLALAFVFRVRPSIFWYLFSAVALTDLYSGSTFGIGVLTLAILVILGYRVSNEIITHRSVVGCFVISGMTGIVWSCIAQLLSAFGNRIYSGVFGIDWKTFFIVVLIQGIGSAIVASCIYVLIPAFLHARSPQVINIRHL